MRYTKHINHKNKYFRSSNRRKSDKRNILYPIILLFLTFSLIIAAIIYFTFKSDYFRLRKESISINKNGFLVEESDLKNLLYNNLDKKLIFNIHLKDVEDTVKKEFKVIKSIELIKNYPKNITINVTERKPIFAIYNQDINNSYMVSEDGYIIGKTNESNEYLFKVNYIDEITEGSYIDSNLFKIYNDIVSQVDKVNLKIKNITFTKKDSVVYLDNNIKVLLSNQKVIENSFYIVDSLLKTQKEDSLIDTIDLRFDKVVVSYL